MRNHDRAAAMATTPGCGLSLFGVTELFDCRVGFGCRVGVDGWRLNSFQFQHGGNAQSFKQIAHDVVDHGVDFSAIQRSESGARRMLNEAQVLQIIPVSRTTLYRMEKAGSFPPSTYISPNRRAWFEDEIAAWQKLVDERDQCVVEARGVVAVSPKGRSRR